VPTVTRATRSRRGLALLVVPALALPLAACTPDVPPAQDAADELVGALRSGDLSGVELTTETSSDPQTQLTEVLAPLLEASGAQEAGVELEKVSVDDDGDDAGERATATLAWTWDLGGDAEWTYLTSAELTYEEGADGSDEQGAWSVAWTPAILAPELKGGERLAVSRVQADRADILDGAGQPIVTARDVWRLGIDKTRVGADAWDSSARALAELVSEGGTAMDPAAYAEKVAGAGDKAFVEAITVRQEAPVVDVAAATGIPGVVALEDTMELAPTSTFARPVLGRAGEATAEIVEESQGRVVAGDVTGLSGLQRQYDEQLAGTPGVVVTAETESGEPRELYRQEAEAGTPLQTTLDVGLQERAEQVLADQEPASAIVAVRPSTGEVLVAASGPGGEGYNTAMLGRYAPGSTFKVVDALAFARAGIAPDTTVSCPETITVGGRRFANVPEYPASATGDVPFRTAFAHSCNTAMIGQHDTVSQQQLHDAAADLGLGVESALGAPAFFGNVPTDADATQHAASLIGQDRIEVSPLTMATVAASVAAGHRVAPVLVQPVASAGAGGEEAAEAAEAVDGGASAAASPVAAGAASASADASQDPDAPASASASPVPESNLTEDEAATLRDLMHAVVTDGSAKTLQDVPGIVGAKTGTAQYGADGAQQHTWMIAIAGDLAVAVFVETGERGSTTSGPLMHEFLTAS
jgi:cell division protein FtsI/penicillin-binding protein 2